PAVWESPAAQSVPTAMTRQLFVERRIGVLRGQAVPEARSDDARHSRYTELRRVCQRSAKRQHKDLDNPRGSFHGACPRRGKADKIPHFLLSEGQDKGFQSVRGWRGIVRDWWAFIIRIRAGRGFAGS